MRFSRKTDYGIILIESLKSTYASGVFVAVQDFGSFGDSLFRKGVIDGFALFGPYRDEYAETDEQNYGYKYEFFHVLLRIGQCEDIAVFICGEHNPPFF